MSGGTFAVNPLSIDSAIKLAAERKATVSKQNDSKYKRNCERKSGQTVYRMRMEISCITGVNSIAVVNGS